MDLAANVVELTKMLSLSVTEERILKAATIRSESLELLAPLVREKLGVSTDAAALLELDRRLSEIEKKKKVKDMKPV